MADRITFGGMSVIVWFKRDLRVQDHPALTYAVSLGQPVLPVYIVEPEYWELPDTSGRQWTFISECLEDLRDDLGALGAPLHIVYGDAVTELERLRVTFGVTEMVSHEETGNMWSFGRDKRVAAWAKEASIRWTEIPQCGVVRRLADRDGWARQRDSFVRKPTLPAPLGLTPVNGLAPGPVALPDIAKDHCPQRQIGGRRQALSLLGGFLTDRGQTYRRAMSSPVEGEVACSRISPHLAMGTLSIREVAQATAARKAEVRGTRTGWIGAMQSFSSRLAWRDHFIQKLEDESEIELRCLHRAYEDMRPRVPDAVRLHAWAHGQTGVPFVDACMRYLQATGWLNFRMRSMVTSFASYHLWLDWRSTGPVLARYFTDYEPGIHWSQLQMQSGTTGMNTIRMYNPVKQGHDQDPSGVFTRRWVPELRTLPDTFLQEPWLWEGAGSVLGQLYPHTIVDLKTAAKAARDAVWAVRKGEAFRSEAAQIVKKHASRKDRQGRFVNDRTPRGRAKTSGARQMKLDL